MPITPGICNVGAVDVTGGEICAVAPADDTTELKPLVMSSIRAEAAAAAAAAAA